MKYLVFSIFVLSLFSCNQNKNIVDCRKITIFTTYSSDDSFHKTIKFNYKKNKHNSISIYRQNDTVTGKFSYCFYNANLELDNNQIFRLEFNKKRSITKWYDKKKGYGREYLYEENLLVQYSSLSSYSKDTTIIEQLRYFNDSIQGQNTTYFIDTNKVCFYPLLLILNYNSDSPFSLLGGYFIHPIAKIEYHSSNDFHVLHNSFDNNGYTTKIVDCRYSIKNNKDTILSDSTVFEIFYEE